MIDVQTIALTRVVAVLAAAVASPDTDHRTFAQAPAVPIDDLPLRLLRVYNRLGL